MDRNYQIIVSRPGLNGPARVYTIEQDGFVVGKLGAKSELCISTTPGNHMLTFSAFGKQEKSLMVSITEESQVVQITAKLTAMGALEISSSGGVTSGESSRKKSGHSILVGIGVTLLAVFCFFLVVAIALSGDSADTSKKENTALPQASVEVKEDDKAVPYGETLSSKFFDISIVDAKWTDALETSLGTIVPKEDGKKLLCLIFSAKNTVDDTRNLGSFNAYVDKQATLPTVVVGSIDDAMVFVGAVASGMEMRAYMVWEISENWEEFQLNYFESSGTECPQHFVIHPEDIGK